MVIGFFICIIALIAIVLFAINPIVRAVNNGIEKRNKENEEKRIKQEEQERRETAYAAIQKENAELRYKLEMETKENDSLRKETTALHSRKKITVDIPEDEYEFYDWGLDEPVGLRRNGKWFY